MRPADCSRWRNTVRRVAEGADNSSQHGLQQHWAADKVGFLVKDLHWVAGSEGLLEMHQHEAVGSVAADQHWAAGSEAQHQHSVVDDARLERKCTELDAEHGWKESSALSLHQSTLSVAASAESSTVDLDQVKRSCRCSPLFMMQDQLHELIDNK